MVHIAVLMMVKNETKRLNVSLNSIKDFADSLVIFDTGSTDDTIEICKNFCDKYKIPLRLKEGTFVNFSESRNVSLEFADSFEDIDYLLLMDCNDELVGGDVLRQEAEKEYTNNEATSYLITQEWFSGEINSYYNIRFIKAHKGWRYKGVVHEYIATTDKETGEENSLQAKRLNEKARLYQDRTQDDDKTGKRFHRDKDLLLKEYKIKPKDARTVFYLAQTFCCLNDHENAYYYYKQRVSLIGFWEEVFQSYLKCGDLSQKLKHEWHDSFIWYMKAYEHTPRVEPLLKISEYYKNKKNFILAYTFLDLACKLDFPSHCNLFVDKLAYEYKRWHEMGIVAYYAKHHKEGKIACLRAIENGTKLKINTDIDKNNLNFYLSDENKNISESKNTEETTNNVNKILTKNQFIKEKLVELKNLYPKSTEKHLLQVAKSQWKNKT